VTAIGPVSDTTSYEWLVTDLLHDPQFVRWDQTQVDAYINMARKQLVKDTGCLRTLQQAYLTAGQEFYSFGSVMGAGITAPGSGYSAPTVAFSGGGGTGAAATVQVTGGQVVGVTFSSYGAGYETAPTMTLSGAGSGAALQAGVCSVTSYDVLSVAVFWGTERYQLQWLPFRVFSAYYRPFIATAYRRQPAAWAGYGQTAFVIAPVPDQTYAVELDTVVFPDLLSGVTQDAIPTNMQDPIPYYAAFLAKQNSKAFGEAQSFLGEYRRLMQEACGAYVGRVPDVYQGGK
jgi:hypothetical protein